MQINTTLIVQSAEHRTFKLWPLIVSLLITLCIAVTASLFTIPQIPGWYSALNKPSFNPPNWLFGPVWSALYVMIAIAAYLVYQKRNSGAQYNSARIVYFVQLLLNFLWSAMFFGMHQIWGALVVIVLLLIAIVANIYYFGKYSKVAAGLLVPYLLWVSFASVLNLYIYLLNR
ncbi:TspO/MBR family protein [Mucilaginibacter sp. PAMB04274]|uniref:TspO/MBR family protein n=1 Tax=Mucilaginibacter sp. PAMB04274 TaxID=3138568 RepID=UPI0031F5FD58